MSVADHHRVGDRIAANPRHWIPAMNLGKQSPIMAGQLPTFWGCMTPPIGDGVGDGPNGRGLGCKGGFICCALNLCSGDI